MFVVIPIFTGGVLTLRVRGIGGIDHTMTDDKSKPKRTWGLSGASETDKEWWDRKGYLGANLMGLEYHKSADAMDLNSRSKHWNREQKFLSAWLQQAILDAIGMTGDSARMCRECHWNDGCTKSSISRTHFPRCKVPVHSIRDCARAWFDTPQAEWVCESLDLRLDYVRRVLKERIVAYETSLHPGLPGEAGSATGSPQVVRRLYRRETA